MKRTPPSTKVPFYCPQCGAACPDKYAAALCCDVRLEGESEDEQFYRLFKDEIDARVAASLEEEERIASMKAPPLVAPPLDIPALMLRLRPGDQCKLNNGDKFYSKHVIEFHAVDEAGASATFADLEWPTNEDGLKQILCWSWPALAHYLETGQLQIVTPFPANETYLLHPRLAAIRENNGNSTATR